MRGRAVALSALALVAIVLPACNGGRKAAPRQPQPRPAPRPMWWYHGYPPRDEIHLKGSVVPGQLVSADGAIWLLEAGNRGAEHLVEIDPRHDDVAARIGIKGSGDALAAGQDRLWVLQSIARCQARGLKTCSAITSIDSSPLRIERRTVFTVPLGHAPSLIGASGGEVWLTDAVNPGGVASRGIVWRLAARTGRLEAKIAVPRQALAFAIGRNRLWLADAEGVLRLIDTRRNRLTRTAIALGRFPPAGLAARGPDVWAAGVSGLVHVHAGKVVERLRTPEPLSSTLSLGPAAVWVVTGDGRLLRVGQAGTGLPIRVSPLGPLAATRDAVWTAGTRSGRLVVLRIHDWPGWHAAPRAPWCRASQLRPSASFQGATGSLAGGIRVMNVSRQACTLTGFPAVRAVDLRGRALPVLVGESRPRFEFDEPPPNWPYATLKPHRYSGFDVWWSNWCGPWIRVVFRVALPHQGGTVETAWHSGPRCEVPGSPSTLAVSPFGI